MSLESILPPELVDIVYSYSNPYREQFDLVMAELRANVYEEHLATINFLFHIIGGEMERFVELYGDNISPYIVSSLIRDCHLLFHSLFLD